jgi:hypothetical protein
MACLCDALVTCPVHDEGTSCLCDALVPCPVHPHD